MFSKVLLERIKIKSYNKYLSSISNEDFLPGGMSKENFIFLTEKLSPFMKSTFDIKVRIIKKGYLEFIVPFQKHLIGNPLTTGNKTNYLIFTINFFFFAISITWWCSIYDTRSRWWFFWLVVFIYKYKITKIMMLIFNILIAWSALSSPKLMVSFS